MSVTSVTSSTTSTRCFAARLRVFCCEIRFTDERAAGDLTRAASEVSKRTCLGAELRVREKRLASAVNTIVRATVSIDLPEERKTKLKRLLNSRVGAVRMYDFLW